ncbi:proline dehydrogenase family protein [Spiractinospora alimapuensis]|uniref:proline dehydrogenase family protein n=1 Tax=Spiractinospora alimapuensis TaxID=2820884 RepID=UPI001F2979AB|nr:proline dehydrogenase family protein [Spiractinospora alimapuensis]QVQ51425.1 proline dehydrogenase family protein [Spiractinospora alimapuensis]
MLRKPLLAAGHSPVIRRVIERVPPTRNLVARFVAGERQSQAIPVVATITRDRLVTMDYLGEEVRSPERAEATALEYIRLLEALADAELADRVEVSVKLSALGHFLEADGEKVALENARRVCRAASNAGTTITVDMEDHTTTDSTLAIVGQLRQDFPWVGAVLQAALRRTEADCRDLAHAGSRVRLCKGAYDEPASVAFRSRREVDRSYVRCLRVLMEGAGEPLVATHDPRLLMVADRLATRNGRTSDGFEYQMLYGIRDAEQRRLAAEGNRVRVYVPYGVDWYGYAMRRVAERPADLALLLRSLAGQS